MLLLSCFPAGANAQSAFDDPGARGTSAAAGGDFHPVTNPITSDVTLGASSQIVVLFKNDDNKPVKADSISLYPSSNISASIGENQCNTSPLQPAEICAISLHVKGLQQGSYRIEMLVRHDGPSKLLTTTISGQVTSSGDSKAEVITSDIETTPTEIDFGSLTESRAQVKSVILRNITSEPIEITDVSIESGAQSGYTVKENCGKLLTGQACVASVAWAPEQKGPTSAVLVVRHTGATGVSTVSLKGQYAPTDAEAVKAFPQAIPGKGLLVSSEEEIDFGDGVEQTSSIAVSLVNMGDVPLTLTGIRMANNENGVKIEDRGCSVGTILNPVEACPLTLTWEPVRVGAILDDLQITHTGARGVLLLPLRGEATKAVNKNSMSIISGEDDYEDDLIDNIKPLSMDDLPADDNVKGEKSGSSDFNRTVSKSDVRSALRGYKISSYSSTRAIVTGVGGSRVVFDKERTVIGGILWEVSIRPNAVEFKNGENKVLMLFDSSLSSVNQNPAQSSTASGSSSGSSSSTPTTGPDTGATPNASTSDESSSEPTESTEESGDSSGDSGDSGGSSNSASSESSDDSSD